MLFFFYIRDKIGFGVLVCLGAFLSNWFGHVWLIGTYPFAITFSSTIDFETWNRILGSISTVIFLTLGTFLILTYKTNRETKYLSTLYWYIGLGNIVFGIIGIE